MYNVVYILERTAMTKLIRLSKSNIEYLTLHWGVFSGCRNLQKGICKVKACWARGIALHYKGLFPNGFEPTFYPEALQSPFHVNKPSIIGVGWVGDIIGYGKEYLTQIFKVTEKCPQHSFVFLTKNYWGLPKVGKFPDNCIVGMTDNTCHEDLSVMGSVNAKKKFVSYEPLYDFTYPNLKWVDGIVIGGQTRPTLMPRLEWVLNLVEEADRLRKKVFLKNNLMPLLTEFGETNTRAKEESRVLNTLFSGGKLRQEFPKI